MRVVSVRSKARSWLTSSTVPPNDSIASSRASMDSTSRWLVGSSKMRKFAPDSIIMASATRAVSPPESDPARRCTESPENPKRPRWPWIGPRPQEGRRSAMIW